MAESKKLSFTLREVARQADVSHTLITLEHPEIGAMIREIKDGLKKPVGDARANHSLSRTNQELREENNRLRGLIPNAKVLALLEPAE